MAKAPPENGLHGFRALQKLIQPAQRRWSYHVTNDLKCVHFSSSSGDNVCNRVGHLYVATRCLQSRLDVIDAVAPGRAIKLVSVHQRMTVLLSEGMVGTETTGVLLHRAVDFAERDILNTEKDVAAIEGTLTLSLKVMKIVQASLLKGLRKGGILRLFGLMTVLKAKEDELLQGQGLDDDGLEMRVTRERMVAVHAELGKWENALLKMYAGAACLGLVTSRQMQITEYFQPA